MDIPTFLELDYRVASLEYCSLMSSESIYQKSHQKFVFKKVEKLMFKWMYGHSGNAYRVATLSKLYLTTTGITMQSLKSIGQF